jgi:hypothetical protein
MEFWVEQGRILCVVRFDDASMAERYANPIRLRSAVDGL